MKASKIRPGMTLDLSPEAKSRYGLDRPFEVVEVAAKAGYLTPWIYCKSERPEGGMLAFKPSDFSKVL